MNRNRRAFALAVALAAIVVLAALASLAQWSAVESTRESAAQRAGVQDRAVRAALRARVDAKLGSLARAALIDHPVAVGGADTVVLVTPLQWPWHRAAVTASGRALIAVTLRASMPAIPWCGPAVFGGVADAGGASVSGPGTAGCPDSVARVPYSEIASLDSALAADLALGPLPDTLMVQESDVTPRVRRARYAVVIGSGRTALGVISAPLIRVGLLATFRGLLLARDSLIAEAGTVIAGAPDVARSALLNQAALHPVGSRGLLLPP